MVQLARRVQRVARHHDRARAQRAVERDHELRAVRQQERHPIALPHAQRLQAGGESVREAVELRVGERRVEQPAGDDAAEERRHRVGEAAGGVAEELRERDGGVGEGVGHARVVVREPRPLDRNAHHAHPMNNVRRGNGVHVSIGYGRRVGLAAATRAPPAAR